ncbi:unnamed protein product, partial [Ectocarpus sp. 13 AM-2016]
CWLRRRPHHRPRHQRQRRRRQLRLHRCTRQQQRRLHSRSSTRLRCPLPNASHPWAPKSWGRCVNYRTPRRFTPSSSRETLASGHSETPWQGWSCLDWRAAAAVAQG